MFTSTWVVIARSARRLNAPIKTFEVQALRAGGARRMAKRLHPELVIVDVARKEDRS